MARTPPAIGAKVVKDRPRPSRRPQITGRERSRRFAPHLAAHCSA
jgi:hypothetical protein